MTPDEKVTELVRRKLKTGTVYMDGLTTGHFEECVIPEINQVDMYNSVYGCDTGCEYMMLTALVVCDHGFYGEFHYGDFGDISEFIREMDAME